MADSLLNLVRPQLLVKEISDIYSRKNFQALQDYFILQNQLMDFGFTELSFTKATANFKFAHNMSYVPQDIIITKMLGPGVVKFNYGKFDAKNIDITVTGACKIRFFFGTYWKSRSTANPDGVADYQESSSSPSNVIINSFLGDQNFITQIINAIVSGGGGGGGGPSPLVGGGMFLFPLNGDFWIANGLAFPALDQGERFIAPYDLTIDNVFMYHKTSGTGGTTELDLKWSASGTGAWVSIFGTTPKAGIAATTDSWCGVGGGAAGFTAPVLATSQLNAGDALRIDIIQVQAGEPNDAGLILQYSRR